MELYSKEELLKELKKEYSCGGECDHCPEVLDAGSCAVLRCVRRIIDNVTPVKAFTKEDMAGAYNEGYMCGNKEAEKGRPRGEWIPVSERLPDNRDWCLGLFKEPDTDFIGIPYVCDYVGEVTKGTTNEGWILSHCTDVDNVSDYFRNLICVAWQPLPKPYKKGGAKE